MNDDELDISRYQGDYQDMITITPTGISSITGAVGATSSYISSNNTITLRDSPEEIIERYELNLLVNEHKMQEQEMIALKDKVPDYADHIKSNIAKEVAKELVKKMTFTKKKLHDEDVHHFIGRVYVFTKEELTNLIKEAQNA